MKPPVEAPTSRHSAALDLDSEPIERVGELDPPARDVLATLLEAKLGILGDELARLRGDLSPAPDPHASGTHRGRGAGARGGQPALGEQSVDPASGLGHGEKVAPGAHRGGTPGTCGNKRSPPRRGS